jgi:hypothetical protein
LQKIFIGKNSKKSIGQHAFNLCVVEDRTGPTTAWHALGHTFTDECHEMNLE